MIRNVLRINVSHGAIAVHGTTHLRNGGFDLRCRGFTHGCPLSRICGEHHKREWNLSAEVVRDTNNASVRDIRVAQQVALQLRGGDLKATNLQNFLKEHYQP